MGEKLLTIDEAAEFTRWSVQTLRIKTHRREIPFVRLGPRSIRFRQSDLLRLAQYIPARQKGRRDG